MCNSSDADEGDSLRFDVNWGDGVQTGQHHPGAGTDPEDGGPATGCGGTACCRHRHRFDSAGTFTVTAEVSDKHLEDQSHDVASLAISTATFKVKAGSPVPEAVCNLVTSFVGNLDGISLTSTFESGMGSTALPAAGWTNVSGAGQVFDVGNGGLIGATAYGNYEVQHDTGVAIQPSTTYTLSLDMGYIAGLAGGNSGYSFQIGTLNGGIFSGLGTPSTGTAPYAGNLNGGVVSAAAQHVVTSSGSVSGDNLAVRWAQTSSLGRCSPTSSGSTTSRSRPPAVCHSP